MTEQFHGDDGADQHRGSSSAEREREFLTPAQRSRIEATRAAKLAALFGPPPYYVLAVLDAVTHHKPQGLALLLVMCLIILFWICVLEVLYVLVVGNLCGELSHKIAFGTSIPVRRMAIALTWVANLSVWGWILVVAMTGS